MTVGRVVDDGSGVKSLRFRQVWSIARRNAAAEADNGRAVLVRREIRRSDVIRLLQNSRNPK